MTFDKWEPFYCKFPRFIDGKLVMFQWVERIARKCVIVQPGGPMFDSYKFKYRGKQ